MRSKSLLGIIMVLAIAGCNNVGLRDLRGNTDGPDEFMVVPSKPLEQPDDFAALPEPTPGGTNRTDQLPLSDAVSALGGNAAATQGGIPASDGALISHASRFGVQQDIRMSLAEADEKFRKRQARFTQIRLFPVDRYDQAYRRLALNPFAEARRFRRAGIATPSAPPEFD